MDDTSVSDAHENNLASSVVSILGIKGSLRFRAHGSTQKAHVVLRRATLFDESSNGGLGGNVVRFTLIAHKRIEVKPGKELLLMLESDDGPFKDRPVVLEGDLKSTGDSLEQNEDKSHPSIKEDIVPVVEEAMPPKMRRTWTRKADDNCQKSRKPAVSTSVGVQTELSYTSVSTQAQPPYRTASLQTFTPSKSVAIQVEPSFSSRTHIAVQADFPGKAGMENTDQNSIEGGSVPRVLNGEKRERSLSPMELDSPPDSPQLSPVIAKSKPSASVSRPKPLPIRSPTYSPPSSIASSSGAQDMQMSPIDLESTANANDLAEARLLSRSPINSSLTAGPKTATHALNRSTSTVTAAQTNQTEPKPVPKPVRKPPIANPFVSGGFVTDFVAPPEKALGHTQKNVNTQKNVDTLKIKVEVDDKLLGMPPDLVKSVPVATPSGRAKIQAVHSPTVVRNAVASSSKAPPSKALPAATDCTPMLNGQAFEKFMATSRETAPTKSHESPPPDPKSLAYIPSGPTSNPLGIRPSSGGHHLRGTAKLPPTVPKLLATSLSAGPTPAKKRLVVGAEWKPSMKTSNSLSSTSDPPPPPIPPSTPVATTNFLSQNLSNPTTPTTPSLPVSAPQKKWKRVTSDVPSSHVTTSSPSASAPRSPSKTDALQENGKSAPPVQGSPLLEKAQAGSLKDHLLNDRLTPSSTNTPTTPVPVQTNGFRNRISGPPALSVHTTTTTAPAISSLATSPTSTLVSHSPAIPPPSTSSKSSPITSKISPTLTHPLPPKPSMSVLNGHGKRDRPRSPEPVPRKRQKRAFRWPTIDSSFSTRLSGDGPLGIRNIAFCSDGTHFALSCNDRTLRIWSNRARTEIARLAHNSPVVAVVWMDDDSGVISLGEDGVVSKWTRSGVNHWQWAKVLVAGDRSEPRKDDDNICLAYWRDRIAVSYPRIGVKVWIWSKGTWHAQRSILRQNVTAIKFINDGNAIIGGTRDGVLWHSDIPNGTLRASAFLYSRIQTLDVTSTGSHVLVGLGSKAFLVGLRQPGNGGSVEQVFTCKEIEAQSQTSHNGGFGAVFATEGQAVLFGSVEGCVLVWDKKKSILVYGLEHIEEDDTIQAVASFNGPMGYLVTGTKSGLLSWWPQPVAAVQ